MQRTFSVLSTLAIAGSLGCDLVMLDGPIGVPMSRADNAGFVGRWITDEAEICEFRLTDGNQLVMGTLVWDDEHARYRAQNHQIDTRAVGDAVYFLKHDDPREIGFVRIQRTGESQLKMHLPDPAKFRTAVESGQLDGEVIPRKNDHYTVRIHVDSPLTRPVFAAADFSDWSRQGDSQILRRIKRFDWTEMQAEP